jgi:YVTN family beta-propeller protein
MTARRAPHRPSATAAIRGLVLALVVVVGAGACTTGGRSAASSASSAPPTITSTTAGPTRAPAGTTLPPPINVYAAAAAGMLSPTARTAKSLVYVPNSLSNTVDVIDPRTYRVKRSFRTTATPQHVVPSWDLKTLWVNESSGNHLTAIDPATGRPERHVAVADPYNLYFTPDGRSALVMAERLRRIDFRNPHTMKLQHSLHVPCRGVNHADFTADGSLFLASCEFSGDLIVVPSDGRRVLKRIRLSASSMPQDVRLSPDGRTFLVADMARGGVWLIDAHAFRVRGFVHTGAGAHGIYPSRDAAVFYVSNRMAGTISVLDARSLRVSKVWRLPGGGSPDMGGVSVDGRQLWLSGRYNSVVYVIDTNSGRLLHRITVGHGPHGLCVWPQPGRYSLGHTGNMR